MLFVKRLRNFFLFCAFVLSTPFVSANIPKLSEWTKKCTENLVEPSLDGKAHTLLASSALRKSREFLDGEVFRKTLDVYSNYIKANVFTQANSWLDFKAPGKDFLAADDQYYVQKLVVKPGSKICFIGDLHGSIHSLLRILGRLAGSKEKYLADDWGLEKNFYIVVLGDFVDRGPFGAEVLATLTFLKLANRHNVFLLPGNHDEYIKYEELSNCDYFRFINELAQKYGSYEACLCREAALNFIRCLPAALFLKSGKNFVQCCHGGIERKYSPVNLMESDDAFFEHYVKPDKKQELGFFWSDFDFKYGDYFSKSHRGEGIFVAHRGATNSYRAKNSTDDNNFAAFFHAHQHAEHGVKLFDEEHASFDRLGSDSHWKNVVYEKDRTTDGFRLSGYHPVFTFSSACGAPGCFMTHDCYSILTTAEEYEDWTLDVYEEKRPETKKIDEIERCFVPEPKDDEDDFVVVEEDFFEQEHEVEAPKGERLGLGLKRTTSQNLEDLCQEDEEEGEIQD